MFFHFEHSDGRTKSTDFPDWVAAFKWFHGSYRLGWRYVGVGDDRVLDRLDPLCQLQDNPMAFDIRPTIINDSTCLEKTKVIEAKRPRFPMRLYDVCKFCGGNLYHGKHEHIGRYLDLDTYVYECRFCMELYLDANEFETCHLSHNPETFMCSCGKELHHVGDLQIHEFSHRFKHKE